MIVVDSCRSSTGIKNGVDGIPSQFGPPKTGIQTITLVFGTLKVFVGYTGQFPRVEPLDIDVGLRPLKIVDIYVGLSLQLGVFGISCNEVCHFSPKGK